MKPLCYISDIVGIDVTKELLSQYSCGIETIHLGTSDSLDHLSSSVARLSSILTKLNRPEVILHGPFLDLNPMSYDSLIQEAVMKRFLQTYDAALQLGIEQIIFHSGMIPSIYFLQGWADRMADFWKRFLDAAYELARRRETDDTWGCCRIPQNDGRSRTFHHRSIRICMENVLDQEIEPFAKVFDQVDHPAFGLCLDIGHAHCYSRHEVSEWVSVLGDRIQHVHVHNNDGIHDQHAALPDGTLDASAIIQQIQKVSPDCSWTIECFNKEDLERSLETFTALW